MVLGPDAGRGSSYWQPDHREYYREYPAHNTVIVDGVSNYRSRDDHPFQVLHLEPPSGTAGVSDWVSFSDTAFDEPETGSDQRRLVSVVRTSPTSGFYVDIFRSRRRDGKDRKHEYLYHNLGQSVTVADAAGQVLASEPTDELGTAHGDLIGYDYFTEKRSSTHDGDFRGEFRVEQDGHPDVGMQMWMAGAEGRTLFTAMSPPARSVARGSAPRELRSNPVPIVLVRQAGEAWTRPFAAVFEPFGGEVEPGVRRIRRLPGRAGFVGLELTSDGPDERMVHVFNDLAGEEVHRAEGKTFQGVFGVACHDADGLMFLYLGHGRQIAVLGYGIEGIEGPVAASLYRRDGRLRVSCSGPVRVQTPEGAIPVSSGQDQPL